MGGTFSLVDGVTSTVKEKLEKTRLHNKSLQDSVCSTASLTQWMPDQKCCGPAGLQSSAVHLSNPTHLAEINKSVRARLLRRLSQHFYFYLAVDIFFLPPSKKERKLTTEDKTEEGV